MQKELMHDLAKMREAAVVETLDECRKTRGISYRDLAKASGISHSTINDIFRRKQMKLWQVFVFAEGLNMSIREVTYLSDERFREEYAQLHVTDAEIDVSSVV
jgi:transcriptional regulator with XRE-family HTH domain